MFMANDEYGECGESSTFRGSPESLDSANLGNLGNWIIIDFACIYMIVFLVTKIELNTLDKPMDPV